MKRSAILITAAMLAAVIARTAAADEWTPVAEALGKSGSVMAGGVYRIGLPRTDLKVTLDGVEIKPGLALGGWLAFAKMGAEAVVMGDLVLTAEEVNPVMTKLIAGGIEVTALHNHLLRNQPFTMYMHVLGRGDPVKLAAALHAGLAESKTPFPAPGAAATPPAAPPAIDLDTAALDQIIGTKGQNNGGIYGFGIARAEPVTEGGMPVSGPMGANQSINFEPLGGGSAAITGDFVLTAQEVAPVMKALRDNGIEVTAVHNHMLDEQPRLFFMHFWGHDDAKKLAQGLKAALSHINLAKS